MVAVLTTLAVGCATPPASLPEPGRRAEVPGGTLRAGTRLFDLTPLDLSGDGGVSEWGPSGVVLSRVEVRRSVRVEQARLSGCFERSQAAVPTLSSVVPVWLTIDGEGQVSEVAVGEASTPDSLRRCVATILGFARLSPPAGEGAAEVGLRLDFGREGRRLQSYDFEDEMVEAAPLSPPAGYVEPGVAAPVAAAGGAEAVVAEIGDELLKAWAALDAAGNEALATWQECLPEELNPEQAQPGPLLGRLDANGARLEGSAPGRLEACATKALGPLSGEVEEGSEVALELWPPEVELPEEAAVARPVVVRVGQVKLVGAVDKRQLRGAIRARRAAVVGCYRRRAGAVAGLQGRVVVDMTLDGRLGRALVSSVAANETGDAALGACVADVMRGLRLTSMADGPIVRVHYPFVFRPGARQPAPEDAVLAEVERAIAFGGERAVGVLERSLGAGPERLRRLEAIAPMFAEAGRFEEAIAINRALIVERGADPAQLGDHLRIVDLQLATGDVEGARAELLRATEVLLALRAARPSAAASRAIKPHAEALDAALRELAALWHREALSTRQDAMAEAAASLYAAWLRAMPAEPHPEVVFGAAELAFKMEEWERALDLFVRATHLSPIASVESPATTGSAKDLWSGAAYAAGHLARHPTATCPPVEPLPVPGSLSASLVATPPRPLPIPACHQKMIEALAHFAPDAPADERAEAVALHAQALMAWGHLDEARKVLSSLVFTPGVELAVPVLALELERRAGDAVRLWTLVRRLMAPELRDSEDPGLGANLDRLDATLRAAHCGAPAAGGRVAPRAILELCGR